MSEKIRDATIIFKSSKTPPILWFFHALLSLVLIGFHSSKVGVADLYLVCVVPLFLAFLCEVALVSMDSQKGAGGPGELFLK